jgi:hypothetical protein
MFMFYMHILLLMFFMLGKNIYKRLLLKMNTSPKEIVVSDGSYSEGIIYVSETVFVSGFLFFSFLSFFPSLSFFVLFFYFCLFILFVCSFFLRIDLF